MTSAPINRIMTLSPVIPVVTLTRAENGPPLAKALLAGGIRVMEVTLRTAAAIDAIAATRAQVPQMCVGAGTVWRASQARRAVSAGAQFVVSPGIADEVGDACEVMQTPYLPGAQTVSEVAHQAQRGAGAVKLFPAAAIGGVRTVRAYASVFPDLALCPTGGISADELAAYLALDNVVCVGGSWLADPVDIEAGAFARITEAAARAVAAPAS